MTQKLYSQEEIQTRYETWANLPTIESKHFIARQKAWDRYCDARDGLAEGTSAKRYLNRNLTSQISPHQLEMFRKRRTS